MKKGKKALAVTAVLLMMAIGSAALAASTAPYSLRPEDSNVPSTQVNGKVRRFSSDRIYKGVHAASQWMRQARLDGIMLELRLFEKNGNGILFQEDVTKASDGNSIRLVLRQQKNIGNALLQLDQEAVDLLKRVNISEIAVVDADYYIQNIYTVSVLDGIRSMLGLAATEQLSVGGLDDPISAVSENGIRRMISQ